MVARHPRAVVVPRKCRPKEPRPYGRAGHDEIGGVARAGEQGVERVAGETDADQREGVAERHRVDEIDEAGLRLQRVRGLSSRVPRALVRVSRVSVAHT
jgi:hypothetical protein